MQINNQQNLTKQERRELRRQEKEQKIKQLRRRRLIKRVALWSFVALLVGGVVLGIIWLVQSPTGKDAPASVAAVAEHDRVKGSRESRVILIEYSDFQCPACATYYPLVKSLAEELGNDIAVVYRHFLVTQPRQRASLASQASEAAGEQGKFWEYHDVLFERQQEWTKTGDAEKLFIQYAQDLGLDKELFAKALDSEKVKDKINQDGASASRARVNVTPTFFLNGEKLQNPRSYEEFRNIIREALSVNP
jgi:protein-disulfide isomerase